MTAHSHPHGHGHEHGHARPGLAEAVGRDGAVGPGGTRSIGAVGPGGTRSIGAVGPGGTRSIGARASDAAISAEGRVARAADRVGALVGFLCALHCALLPFLLGVLPALGLGFLAGVELELTLLAVAGVVAAVAVVHALRRHRRRGVVAGLVAGFACLTAGVLVEDQHQAHGTPAAEGSHAHPGEHSLLSTLLSIAGGLLLAVSHVRNSRAHHGGGRDGDGCDVPEPVAASCAGCGHDHGRG